MKNLRQWRAIVISWIVWLYVLGTLAVISRQVAFAFHINIYFLWNILGMPENQYGFRNIVLPDILVYLLIASPSALVGLYVYEILSSNHLFYPLKRNAVALLGVFVFMIITGILSIAAPFGQIAVHTPANALLFVVFLLALTAATIWLLQRAFAGVPSNGS